MKPLRWFVAWYADYGNAEGMARHLRLNVAGVAHVDVVERQINNKPFGVLYAAEAPVSVRHDVPPTLRVVR